MRWDVMTATEIWWTPYRSIRYMGYVFLHTRLFRILFYCGAIHAGENVYDSSAKLRVFLMLPLLVWSSSVGQLQLTHTSWSTPAPRPFGMMLPATMYMPIICDILLCLHACHLSYMPWCFRHTHPKIQNPDVLRPSIDLLDPYVGNNDSEDVGTLVAQYKEIYHLIRR